MSTNYQDVKNFRNRQKKRIIYVMGGQCAICGYKKCDSALELHHLNPDEKEFTFSNNINKAWQDIANELPKTILVCANCHREIHAGLIDNNQLQTSFNIDKEHEINEEITLHKQGSQKLCKYCGRPISEKATLCVECSSKLRQKVERPSREELKEDIRTLPFLQIGKKYGVTDNAIRKWCDKYNLPRKATQIKTYTDEEWDLI